MGTPSIVWRLPRYARTQSDTMSRSLFREEVIKARRADWLGELHLHAPKFGWPFFFAGLATVVVILIVLGVGHYTRREHVSGVLRVKTGVLNIVAQRSGLVTRVLVGEGQKVQRGQPLIEISGEIDSVNLGNTHAHINQDLQSQRSRLEQDLVEQDAILAARKQELERQIALSILQVESVSSQLEIQNERVAALTTLHEKWLSFIDSGVISKSQLLQSQDNLLQQRSIVQDLERARISIQLKQSELKEQLLRAPIETATQKNELARRIADVATAVSENEAQRGIVLKAQRDGVVTNLLVHSGQQVEAAQQLITLIPDNSELIAELLVPTRAIGFVEIGSDVVLRYEAFPYQKFGAFKGTIAEISRSGLELRNTPEDTKQPSVQDTFYRVLVKLERQQVDVYGQREALRPGMQLEADITVERRRLLEWVFEPLYGISRKRGLSMRNTERRYGS